MKQIFLGPGETTYLHGGALHSVRVIESDPFHTLKLIWIQARARIACVRSLVGSCDCVAIESFVKAGWFARTQVENVADNADSDLYFVSQSFTPFEVFEVER